MRLSIPSPGISSIQVGPLVVHFYAICILAGIALAVWIGAKRWVARGGSANQMVDMALWTVPIGIIGGRFFHVITHWNFYFAEGTDPLAVFRIWEGGLAIYGGLIFGTLGAWIGARAIGVRFWSVADALAPAILVAQAIGRLGNYFNKELFGLPTDLPWGLEIPKANPAYPMGFPEGVLFHPTFLYEMIWNLLGFVVIVYWLERKFNLRNGRAFAVYLIYYSVGRAMIENIRIDNSEMLLGLRTNVWSAILTAAIGLGLLVWSNRRLPGTEESIWLPGKAPAELEFKDAANQSDDV